MEKTETTTTTRLRYAWHHSWNIAYVTFLMSHLFCQWPSGAKNAVNFSHCVHIYFAFLELCKFCVFFDKFNVNWYETRKWHVFLLWLYMCSVFFIDSCVFFSRAIEIGSYLSMYFACLIVIRLISNIIHTFFPHNLYSQASVMVKLYTLYIRLQRKWMKNKILLTESFAHHTTRLMCHFGASI